MSQHPHHKIIKAYSEDTSIVIEGYLIGKWEEVTFEFLVMCPNATLRIKPKQKFVTVGRHTWSMPITMKDVPEDESVWGFSPEYKTAQVLCSMSLIKQFVQKGFAHLTEKAATTHMNAITAISEGDID